MKNSILISHEIDSDKLHLVPTIYDAVSAILSGQPAATAATATAIKKSPPPIPASASAMDVLKAAAKLSQKNWGKVFTEGVLSELGVAGEGKTLSRRVSAITDEQREAVLAAWKNGPVAKDEDESEEEDDWGDKTPATKKMTPEEVIGELKTFAKAHDREAALAIMKSQDVGSLAEVYNADAATLAAIVAALK